MFVAHAAGYNAPVTIAAREWPLKTWMRLLPAILLLFLLTACQEESPAPAAAPSPPPGATAPAEAPAPAIAGGATATAIVLASPTPIPPTPTPSEPLAALVNGEPVFLAAYERELARYEQGQLELGLEPGASGPDYRRQVLDNLVDQALIAQAAAADNIVVTVDDVQQRLDELRQEAGDEAAFLAWLEANQFGEEEFRAALAGEMLAEHVKERVTADVPFAVPQVHARYLQVDDAALAASLRDQIVAGADFGALAQQYSLDRQTGGNGGDLGWFPRQTLLVTAVEEAAFALGPGEVSEVIALPAAANGGTDTYYMLQVLEREEARALTPQQRAVLLQEAFESWLSSLRERAQITLLVDAGG